jgi:hypothetical protein
MILVFHAFSAYMLYLFSADIDSSLVNGSIASLISFGFKVDALVLYIIVLRCSLVLVLFSHDYA